MIHYSNLLCTHIVSAAKETLKRDNFSATKETLKRDYSSAAKETLK